MNDRRCGALLWWNPLYPALDPLRGDPRFQRLVAASGPRGGGICVATQAA